MCLFTYQYSTHPSRRFSAIVEAFITHISVTFRDTGKYPWVLGYGIAVKPIADPRPGSPMFLPSRFWLSTTPAEAVDGSWVDPDDATLNFCIINSDVHDESKVDPARNWYAGILPEPFNVTTKATNLHTDGTFAMSNNMFFNHWIKPVIFDPFNTAEYIGHGRSPTIKGGEGDRTSSKSQDWSARIGRAGQGDGPDPFRNGTLMTALSVSMNPDTDRSGTIQCIVNYTSTLLDGGYPSEDTLRRIVVNIAGTSSGMYYACSRCCTILDNFVNRV